MGAGQHRLRLPVERASGPRQGRRRRRAAVGVRGRDGGPEHAVDVVPAGGGAGARGRGGVLDALRVELHAGEHLRRRAHGVLALLRRAADQLPVQAHRVGHRDGDRQRRPAGRGGGAHTGGHGGGERAGDAPASDGAQGKRRGRGEARRTIHAQRGQAHRRGAPSLSLSLSIQHPPCGSLCSPWTGTVLLASLSIQHPPIIRYHILVFIVKVATMSLHMGVYLSRCWR